LNLFWGALCPQDDILFDPWFIQNVNFDGKRDGSHVSFFEIIWCTNGDFKPINLTMDEVFGLHNILIMGLLRKVGNTMVHIIPRIIRGGHSFHDLFIVMKDGGGGRKKEHMMRN